MDARLFMLNVGKDPAEATRIAAQSARRIEKKELKLLDFVQSLGEYLTEDDKTVRAKAIAYLSAILDSLEPKTLSRQQVIVINQFLCDRLDDETGLKETSLGLIALQKMQRFGNEEAILVVSGLFKTDMQKHPQGTRFVVLTLLDGLMSSHRDALKSMGGRFVTGLVSLVGGEKDPRNLMIVFSVVKVVLVEFDIVMHIELLFDVVYCYFPITFRPPPGDPYGITAQDLKLRLRDCIASTGYFAAQVFPQLIEKLDSTSQSVKKDVLQTITACALSYGPQTISIHSTQLWDAIKFEILGSTEEEELAVEALLVSKAIAEALSFGLNMVPPSTSPLARYLNGIVKECLKLLQEPQQKQAKPAGQILAKVATASSAAYAYIIQNTIPVLLLIYSDADGLAKQRALLEVLNLLLESTLKVYGEWGDMTAAPTIEGPLRVFREKLFGMYSQALMGSAKEEAGFRIIALRGLTLLSKARRFLEENEVGIVVQYLDEVALELQEKNELREEALQSLKDISRLKPNLIMSITFPAFMAQLPDYEGGEKMPYTATLEALAKLSLERAVFEVLLTRLLNKLEVILYCGCDPSYPRAILSTLLYVLQKLPERGHEDMKAHFTRLVPFLLTKTILPLIRDEWTSSKVMTDDGVLDVTGRLMNILIRPLDEEQQAAVAEQMFNLFLRGVPCDYLPATDREVVAEKFKLFQIGPRREDAGCVIIFAYVLAALRREVPLPIASPLVNFLEQNLELVARPKSPAHRMGHLHIIELITNKWIKMPTDLEPLQRIMSELLGSIFDKSSKELSELLGEKLRVSFWITKALVLRGDKFGMEVTGRFVELLGNTTYGTMACKGFAGLLGEDDFLNKENYAVVRLLTKQRIFTFCVPKIVDGFKGADSAVKPNYLVALSNILRNVSSKIILTELRNILPLLLQSLDLNDPAVKSATIETLFTTIQQYAEAVKEHVSSLISRLLMICANREINPPRVRAAALRCLSIFPGAIRNELLLPIRRQVLKSLVGVLDDPRRNVRKEAVDCRAKWFAMDEPET